MSIEQRIEQFFLFLFSLVIFGLSLRQFYTIDRPFFQWLVCKDAFILMYGIVLNFRIISVLFLCFFFALCMLVDLEDLPNLSEEKEK